MEMNFECNNCGKCCHFPDGHKLVISTTEWTAYADRFPLYLSFEFFRADLVAVAMRAAIPGLTKEDSWEHLANTGHLLKVPTEQGSMYLLLRAEIFALPGSDGFCQALVDNRCSIYDDRPLVCKVYPVTTDQPVAALATISLEAVKRDIEGKGYECRIDDTAPFLIADGNISPEIHGLLDKFWFGLQAVSELMLKAEGFDRVLGEAAKTLRTQSSHQWRADLIPILRFMSPKAVPDPASLLRRQMQLLQGLMAAPGESEAKEIATQIYDAYLMQDVPAP